MTDVDPSPRLGFVVIGRNEGERLGTCLASLSAHGLPVVYADSASSDGSPALAERAGAVVVRLDDCRPMNAARGRSEGFDALLRAHPGLDFVQFLDGDCVLHPDWVRTATAFLRDHPTAGVACGRRSEVGGSVYIRLCDEEWQTPVGEAEACGGDALMRVAAYRAAGGFRTDLMAGEEPELCRRMRARGWTIWRLDAPMTVHDAAIHRLGQWLRRSMRGGFGFAQVWQATRGGTSPPLFGRQLRSALLWAVALPLATLAFAVLAHSAWLLLLAPALWLLQVARIAARRGIAQLFSWQYGALLMAAKFGEAFGALRFFASRRQQTSINYKAVPR